MGRIVHCLSILQGTHRLCVCVSVCLLFVCVHLTRLPSNNVHHNNIPYHIPPLDDDDGAAMSVSASRCAWRSLSRCKSILGKYRSVTVSESLPWPKNTSPKMWNVSKVRLLRVPVYHSNIDNQERVRVTVGTTMSRWKTWVELLIDLDSSFCAAPNDIEHRSRGLIRESRGESYPSVVTVQYCMRSYVFFGKI